MRALRIADLAAVMIDCLAPRHGLRPQDIAVNVIGSKPGEKLYEELLTEEESHRSLQLPNFYVILPAFRELYGVEYAYEAAQPHGKGGQTRGYININDTLQCVAAAVQHPAGVGELRIFNQITETFSVRELARRVQKAGRRRGLDVTVEHVKNPRTEAEEHYYNPTYKALRELGVVSHPLDGATLDGMPDMVQGYAARIRPEIIFHPVQQRKPMKQE